MIESDIQWDEKKNQVNQSKHGIAFEEASTVFDDPYARQFADPDHSQEEDRFLLVGTSNQLRVLLVCYCERFQENIIRIISARRLNKEEKRQFKRGDFK